MKGDVCLWPNLGLSLKDIRLLSKLSNDYEIELWHAAGNISFDEASSDETFSVNFDGTKNVVEFCKKIGIKRIHYISTAYVAGDRQKLAMTSKLLIKKRTGLTKNYAIHMKNQKLKS